MQGLIARKLGMTQVYDEKGTVTPVTVVQAGPCVVLEVKTKEKNGYCAVQLGFGERKAKNVGKAVVGHVRKAGLESTPPAVIREIRLDSEADCTVGAQLKADLFSTGSYVDVTGIVKGRGFQGVVKRYNFAGGRYSHVGGWKRCPGSIGQCEWPGHVQKGKKLPGQMGNVRRTIQNLEVVKVVAEENLIFLKGAVPGPNGGTLTVRKARKKTDKTVNQNA
jgi:large subunit ribosomal protein L3